MKINFNINDELLAEAKRLSDIADKRILIEKALQLYVAVES